MMIAGSLRTLVLCVLVAFPEWPVAQTAPGTADGNPSGASLPACLNSKRDIDEIKKTQKEHGRTPHKYDGYRKVLGHSTDIELAARLAYAESIAANCPEREDQVMGLVSAVIGNRVRIRRGDVKSVVFQRNQFASSLNIYPESRYRDFLCPNNPEMWQEVVATIRTNLDGMEAGASLPKEAVNYYLYRHSERFDAPDWKLQELRVADEATRQCIRVFRDGSWR